jgi:hypothetical protein
MVRGLRFASAGAHAHELAATVCPCSPSRRHVRWRAAERRQLQHHRQWRDGRPGPVHSRGRGWRPGRPAGRDTGQRCVCVRVCLAGASAVVGFGMSPAPPAPAVCVCVCFVSTRLPATTPTTNHRPAARHVYVGRRLRWQRGVQRQERHARVPMHARPGRVPDSRALPAAAAEAGGALPVSCCRCRPMSCASTAACGCVETAQVWSAVPALHSTMRMRARVCVCVRDWLRAGARPASAAWAPLATSPLRQPPRLPTSRPRRAPSASASSARARCATGWRPRCRPACTATWRAAPAPCAARWASAAPPWLATPAARSAPATGQAASRSARRTASAAARQSPCRALQVARTVILTTPGSRLCSLCLCVCVCVGVRVCAHAPAVGCALQAVRVALQH